jgi:hypothetical protein
MRSVIAIVVLLGLALSAVALIILRGDKAMYMRPNDIEARSGPPPSDTNPPGAFETATFALG